MLCIFKVLVKATKDPCGWIIDKYATFWPKRYPTTSIIPHKPLGVTSSTACQSHFSNKKSFAKISASQIFLMQITISFGTLKISFF